MARVTIVRVGFSAAAGGELAAVGDEQVLDVVGLALLVDHAVARRSRSSGWCRDCASRDRAASRRRRVAPDRLVDRARPACRRGCAWRCRWGDRRSGRSGSAGRTGPSRSAERDPVALLRHVLADDPHPGHVGILLHLAGEAAAPGAGIEERRHERQSQRQGLHLVAADEAALGIEPGLVAG